MAKQAKKASAKKTGSKRQAKAAGSAPRARHRATTPPVNENTMIFPEAKVITELLEAKRQSKKRTSSIASTFGAEKKKHIKDNHLDATAWDITAKLDAMDDERLAITLPHLLQYIVDAGIDKRVEKAAPMFQAGEMGPATLKKGDGEDHDDESEAGEGTVQALGAAARAVAEQAGRKLNS